MQYNLGFNDEFCQDRNQSFRKAVRANRKNERYLNEHSTTEDSVSGQNLDDNHAEQRRKYNWKHFLPWTRKSTSYPPKHPIDDCGFIQMILLSWITPILTKGFKSTLEVEDLGKLSRNDSSFLNYKRINKLWDDEVRVKGLENASAEKVLFRAVKTRIIVGALVFIISIIMSFIGPTLIINNLLQNVERKDGSLTTGLSLVVGFLVAELVRTFIHSLTFFLNIRTGVRARSMILTLVYNKMCRLKNAGDKSTGELVNICANDAQRVFESCAFGPYIVGGPIALTIVITYTTYLLGPTALIGCFIFIIMFFVQAFIGNLSGKFRGKGVRITDQRVKLMNEVLNCIKLIKMYAWEKSFAKVIYGLRAKESKIIGYSGLLQTINISMTRITSSLATVATFLIHVYLGNALLPSQAFTVIAVYNTMAFVFAILPFSTRSLSETRVSMTRLKSLLIMEEFEPWKTKPEDENIQVEISQANFGWYEVEREQPRKNGNNGNQPPSVRRNLQQIKTHIKPTLFDIDLTLSEGSLVGVCGAVGCGKSSLVNAILGQMNLTEGRVAIGGSIAYVAQQAWLMNATVRENIVFGKKYKPDLYEKVLTSCNLKKDLEIFTHGDQTEIGERGVNLSGGQKQRISLARAVYADKDIYLLDDPLSAVDSHVGLHIFDSCIKGTLSGKTILFVTHQLQYLNRCDRVVFMKEGRLAEVGRYDELMKNKNDFATLIEKFNRKMESDKTTPQNDKFEIETKLEEIVRKRAASQYSEVEFVENHDEHQGFEDSNKEGKGRKDVLMKDEERKAGSVSFSTYMSYLKAAGGYVFSTAVILLFVFNILIRSFIDIWLGRWTNAGDGNTTSTNQNGNLKDNPDLNFYALIYGLSFVFLLVFLIIKCFVFVGTVMHASTNLHNQVFQSVTSSPMSFFDTTPIGQILNRFSKDIDDLDTRLPFFIDVILLNITLILVTLGLICYFFPWFLLPLFFLMLLFFMVNVFYRRSSRELKRLDNITRSPIFSHLSASVQGLSTLHAYDKMNEFSEKFHHLVDMNTLPFFIFSSSSRWLALRLDSVSIAISSFTALLIVLFKDSVPAAYGGLAISYAIRISGLLQFTVRTVAEAEALFISVDRLRHYIKDIAQEAAAFIEDKKPAEEWPDQGAISFKDFKMRYRDNLPLVLKGITCNIRSQEKIGIVGRTGSGKSSLGVSLFRLIEPTSGTITIDGVNIAEIGLCDLRSKLSIIPQDPVLFIGTVRYNLDPFDKYADEEIWRALDRAHIKDAISNLPLKLLAPVVENGENFSVGERQLMCMARALLRKCKILMLDEATAAIDTVTDAKIQDTIRVAFKDCTLLTIAHRLDTVMDADRIMVLEEGQIVEFDKPSLLSADQNSFFHSLMQAVEESQKDRRV